MKHYLALIAFILGFIGVGMAAFQNNFIATPIMAAAAAPKAAEQSLKEVGVQVTKQLIEEKILRRKPPPPPEAPPALADPRKLPLHPYQMLYTALGVVAMGLGILAWSRKDHLRLAGGAVALGVMAVAWQWVLIAVAVAVVILILSQLGA